jgi:7-keto-8-aminopelargonate synthetase-like enzyme
VFSTAMPPAIAAATLASIELVRGAEGDARRRALAGHARRFRELVLAAGGARESPIVPVIVGDDRRAMALSARLLEARVFVQGIRPPTVPPGTARLRIGLVATLAEQDLESSAFSLNDAMRHDARGPEVEAR